MVLQFNTCIELKSLVVWNQNFDLNESTCFIIRVLNAVGYEQLRKNRTKVKLTKQLHYWIWTYEFVPIRQEYNIKKILCSFSSKFLVVKFWKIINTKAMSNRRCWWHRAVVSMFFHLGTGECGKTMSCRRPPRQKWKPLFICCFL